MTAADNGGVAPEEALLRRVVGSGPNSMMIEDAETKVRRPATGAFEFGNDGCSVYQESLLAAEGLDVSDVALGPPHDTVVSVTAGQATTVGYGVEPDPWPPDSDGHGRDAAHTLLTNYQPLGKNAHRRALRTLLQQAVIRQDPGAARTAT